MSSAEDARARAAQPQLPGFEVARPPARRVELAVAESIAAATVDPDGPSDPDRWLTTADAGMAALAVECARAVDVASQRNDPYGVAAAAQRLQDALTRLRLDPTARKGGDADGQQLQTFLATLAEPS